MVLLDDQSTNIASPRNYLEDLNIDLVLELINSASAKKTAPVPNVPDIAPANAGKRN